jgi:hypothetical protein
VWEVPVCPPGQPDGWGSGARELIAAEASGRFDRLEFVEIEFVDGLQGLSGGAVLKVVGQSLEPGAIFGLEGDEDSNGIAPALSAAAMVSRSPVADHRPGCGADSAMPGLSLSISRVRKKSRFEKNGHKIGPNPEFVSCKINGLRTRCSQ